MEEGEEVSEVAAKPKKGKRRAVEQDPKKLFAGKRLEWGRQKTVVYHSCGGTSHISLL